MRWFLCFLSKNTTLTEDNILEEIEKQGIKITTPSLARVNSKYYPSFIHVYLETDVPREILEQKLIPLGLSSLLPLDLQRDEEDGEKRNKGKKDKEAILEIFRKGLKERRTIKSLCLEAGCSNMYYNNNIKPLLETRGGE